MRELKIQLRYTLPLWLVLLLTSLLPDNRYSIKIRGFMASFFIKKCGKNFTLGRDVTLLNSYNLEIGDDVYIAKGCWINALGGVYIEDEVIFGPYVVISSLQHVFKNKSVRFGGSSAAPVTVGVGSWLASHSSVKSGVSIERGNIVAANSFVTKSTKEYTIYGGVPAKELKENSDGVAQFYRKRDLG